MASENNLALLREAGLLQRRGGSRAERSAVASSKRDSRRERSTPPWQMPKPRSTKSRRRVQVTRAQQEPPRSLEMGIEAMPGANLALISTPERLRRRAKP